MSPRTARQRWGKPLMAAKTYTEFPALSHGKKPGVPLDGAERLIEVGVETSAASLAISWAILLRSYTEEQTPIFKFDERSVAVDLHNGVPSSVQEIAGVLGSRLTGISSLEVGPLRW